MPIPSEFRVRDNYQIASEFTKQFAAAARNVIAARAAYDDAITKYVTAQRDMQQATQTLTTMIVDAMNEVTETVSAPFSALVEAAQQSAERVVSAERAPRGIMLSRIDSDSDTAAEQTAERERQYEP